MFGERQGVSPTFTSYKNWVGYTPVRIPDADYKSGYNEEAIFNSYYQTYYRNSLAVMQPEKAFLINAVRR